MSIRQLDPKDTLPGSVLPHFSLRTLATGALIALASAALAGCTSTAATPEPPRNALVAHPVAAAAADAEVYSGDVHARYESQLGFRVNGKIKARFVDVGAKVEAGQALAELDPLDLKLQVSAAAATVNSARANRDTAKAEYDRYQPLLGKNYVSHTQFDAVSNALKAAQAQLQQAEAALAVANNQAEYTTLRADHAGLITAITAEAGQVVSAGAPIATLARDGAMEVEIAVPENRIASLHAGTAVAIESWAEAGKQLGGLVREISPEADKTTRTYRVRVSFDDANHAPRLGQTARVYVASTGAANNMLVPLSALTEQGGKASVFVVDAKTHAVRLAPVTVAAYREQGATLSGGVGAQDWIVTAGVHKLREGEAIAPIDAQNRPISF